MSTCVNFVRIDKKLCVLTLTGNTRMKLSTIAVLVIAATTSINAAQADQFSAANSALGDAIADNAMHQDAGTQQRVHDAYSRAKLAAADESGEAISHSQPAAITATTSALSEADGKALSQMNIQRTRQQVVAGGVAEVNAQMQAALQAQQVANYGVKQSGVAQYAEPQQAISYSGLTQRPGYAVTTMNFSAAQVAAKNPQMAVRVQIDGVQQTVTAAQLAQVAPQVQIAVPQTVSYFQNIQPVKGGADHDNKGGHTSGHDGRGSDNAHSHAFGGHGYGHDNSRSEGFGGHSHFH